MWRCRCLGWSGRPAWVAWECFSVRLSVRGRDQTISVAVKRIPKKTMEGSSDRMTPRRVLEVFMNRWLAWFAWCLANRGLIYRLPLPEQDQNLGFLPCPLVGWDLKEGADGIRLSAGQNRVFELSSRRSDLAGGFGAFVLSEATGILLLRCRDAQGLGRMTARQCGPKPLCSTQHPSAVPPLERSPPRLGPSPVPL